MCECHTMFVFYKFIIDLNLFINLMKCKNIHVSCLFITEFGSPYIWLHIVFFRSPTAIMQLKYYKTNIIQLIKLIKNRWNGISRKCFALIVRVFTIQWFFCIYTKHKETHCVYTRFASHTHVAFAMILLHKHDQLISKNAVIKQVVEHRDGHRQRKLPPEIRVSALLPLYDL